ncbi:unnamed protein product [Ilex paraguariensis]|uniref:Uncharacterized protein n=1 Tax=Ilex paraguariensis TaxID=185542 RepID=A0ABC8RI74_9AQUA
MAKVHPQVLVASSTSFKQEVFTIWMKSLIFGSNGCTVFDSNGQIVYRVDNYNHKYSDEVHLMDRVGKVLFTIVKERFKFWGSWKGYRCGTDLNKEMPVFQVRRTFGILRGDSVCEVDVGLDKNQRQQYRMEIWTRKSSCKIVEPLGELVAEGVSSKQRGLDIMGYWQWLK